MTRRYDLHSHTAVSPCSAADPSDVVAAAVARGLDGIAVTDHDTTAGVDRIREAAPPELTVVPGVEVTTSEGHLLALGIEEPPPRGVDPLDAVAHVHERGGVAVLAHPFDRLRQYYRRDLSTLAERVDAVEVVNSRCLFERFNRRAAAFADEHGLAVTGGSDTHFPMEIGRAVTEVEGDEPVLEAIRAGRTRAVGRGRYPSGHVATKLHQFGLL